jgi:hypothetical protein
VVAKLLHRHKDINQGQNTMFIPRLTIPYSVREVGRIVKFINQPMQYKLTRL